MSTAVISHAYRLRRRPVGAPGDSDLELTEERVEPIGEGQALIRTLYLSLDPTNRIWMSDMRGYAPPVELGAVMRGLGLGQVAESNRPDLKAGDLVYGYLGWQEHHVADVAKPERRMRVLPDPLQAPLPAYLGVLGHTGLTAYIGMEIGRPQPGETVVVSAAAGAVGSVAGQIAKARSARAVGIAGGRAKCEHVVDTLGLDACVDRKSDSWRDQLAAATPDGIDVDFENVGGEIMDEVLMRINIGARIVLCGMISQYDASGAQSDWRGQVNINQILMQRATMTGFITGDHPDKVQPGLAYLAGLLAEGRLHYDETIIEGFDRMLEALGVLFAGGNTGKLIVHVADPR
jgi:NADPH-dependent curcumin reductase CurA